MQKRMLRIVISAAAIGVLLLGTALYFRSGAAPESAKAKSFLSFSQLPKLEQKLLSGFVATEMDAHSARSAVTNLHNYTPTGDDGCPQNRGGNIKVNQNCLNVSDVNLQGRAQANNETSAAQDPNNPNHIIISDNDYRRGDGNCYAAFSRDGGQNWTDTTIPMGFTSGTTFGNVLREYWEAGGDTSVAWDTKGNAYLNCMVFQRGLGVTNNPDQSSGIYLFRSTGNFGASWNFTGRPVAEQFTTGTTTGLPLLDKPYMTVDNHAGSPFQDRIYVTWTLFALNSAGNVTANIYEAHSNDYGESFSSPVLVSSTSPLCPNVVPGDPANSCDANQFSQPFTGPDGALYIVWDNFNNSLSGPNDNHNQVLLARSTDGGATFSPLVKASDYYDLPDCATYQGGQDLGRACVPEKGKLMNSVFRAANYPVGGVDPTHPSTVVVTLGSYINRDSNEANGCIPAGISPATGNNLYTGVKKFGACSNKILVSVSKDGGATFTGTTTDPRQLPVVNQAPGQEHTDQWWQWAAFTTTGKLAVSYYDRQYGQDEFNGNMDITLSGSRDFTSFASTRVTSGSMPLPTQFPNSLGNSVFFGDYSGLSALTQTAHPAWMDTRSHDLFLCPGTGAPGVPPALCLGTEPNGLLANDQDIFTAAVSIP